MTKSSLAIPLLALLFVGGNILTPPPRNTTWQIDRDAEIISFFSGDPLELSIDTASTTAPTQKPPDALEAYPFLAHYPFEELAPEIEVAEGFAAYEGYLGDTRGEYHKGIDYIRRKGNAFLPFNVYTMHHGEAWQGKSETWGNFVIVRRTLTPTLRYYTVYAHLDGIPQRFPKISEELGVKIPGIGVSAGKYIGFANTSGNTKGVAQLHIELHEENLAKGTWLKLDPYGVYSTKSSHRYPDPGKSLEGLQHYWISNTPAFVR